jgi:hypothetical protein
MFFRKKKGQRFHSKNRKHNKSLIRTKPQQIIGKNKTEITPSDLYINLYFNKKLQILRLQYTIIISPRTHEFYKHSDPDSININIQI